jgi:hypothetical protein
MSMMNIYEMMKSGMSQEEIFNSFKQECASARETIAAEEAAALAKEQEARKEALMSEGRAHTINAIVAYLKAFGEPDPSEQEIKEMENQIKELEEGLMQMARFYALSKREMEKAPKQKVKVVSGDAEATAAAIRKIVSSML